MKKEKSKQHAIFIIGALFFVFGFVTWLNSILIPFLKTVCELNNFQASFVTFAFYISYFVMAIPSSFILNKTGFTRGMALGLIVMAIGATLFVPAALERSYPLFLVALFLQGTGLALLQTAANPYVTILGPLESAARRMSIMGVCNKIAGMIGILVLSSALFSNTTELYEQIKIIGDGAEKALLLQELSHRIIFPYLIMTAILIGLVLFIKAAKLPEVEEEEDNTVVENKKSIFSYPYLWFGVLAIFFYVGAEVISIDYLVNYGRFMGLPESIALRLGVFALIALVIGYFTGILFIPKIISQRMALIIQVILAILLVIIALTFSGIISILAILGLSFAHAIMWPAIWPLSIHNLGKYTKLGSAFLIMAIAGGAIIPLFYGKLSDIYNPQVAFAVLFISYAYILFFATYGYKIGIEKKA
ncbi:MAG TPA: sugar MFS transporter [Bacteroidales bacterium]|jgi:FHS family L-fucose permease-like MFS transporter|nr:sugar MFS transporter [Bacteroidales bacterium]HPY81418.1 sugar MFS transporter [Bacteroidales bacterium]HQB20205.1 sugar MFS transporter [Bacteroidales bacterium]HXK74202.1 sugar MFS transporter [Bacteroidales bacterium]